MIIKDKAMDPFEIHVEELQYVLKERKVRGEFKNDGTPTKNPGEEYLDDVGYYGNIEHIFKPLSRRLLARRSDVLGLDEFLYALKNIVSQLKECVERAGL